MDIIEEIGYRSSEISGYDDSGYNPYDWERFGILPKVIPGILYKGNPILVTFLQMLDRRCIMMFKYIGILKNFKCLARVCR